MFYDFRQNNSGGVDHFDAIRGITIKVIVEADSVDEANDRAREIGLYFNGVDEGLDCGCCGDRWYEAWDGDGAEVPSLYGTPLSEWENVPDWRTNGEYPDVYVHLKDGRFFGIYNVDGQYVYKGDNPDTKELI